MRAYIASKKVWNDSFGNELWFSNFYLNRKTKQKQNSINVFGTFIWEGFHK